MAKTPIYALLIQSGIKEKPINHLSIDSSTCLLHHQTMVCISSAIIFSLALFAQNAEVQTQTASEFLSSCYLMFYLIMNHSVCIIIFLQHKCQVFLIIYKIFNHH